MGIRQFIAIFVIIGWIITGWSSPVAAAQDLQQLRSSTAAFVRQQWQAQLGAKTASRIEVDASRLDSRLNLADCAQPPETQIHGIASRSGKQLVKVSCSGTQPWTIYIPVTIRQFSPVVVAAMPLTRGRRIAATDLLLMEKDINSLNQQFFSSKDQVIGMEVKRNLSSGRVLKPAFLETANVVQRGDEVYISASQGGVSVQMPATALSDGKLGEQIAVKNRSSQKTVQARVTGPGQVEVVM